jgi:hypothetical protein
VNAVICDHKDCERTDATRVDFEHWSKDGEFLDKLTYYFCPDHRKQLLELKESRTLPPEEWGFGEPRDAPS